MAQMPVGRLMINMGIPMIISMMLQAVYNIVDSAFVANMEGVGEAALNTMTLAFPVQMLMVAVGIGTGVGVNALLGVEGYLRTQTQNPQVLTMAEEYLGICCGWSFGILYFSLYEKVLQATGKSLYSTIAQVTGAILNIILDPIMIYGWFGCPQFGVRGAAYATFIGQIASAGLGLYFHLKKNSEIRMELRDLVPSSEIIKGIYAIGFPAIIAQALMSVMTYLLNVIFVEVSEAMVTAYGLYYKVQQFILFAAFGLRDAITPIVSYNYGMGSKARVRDGIRYGLSYTLVLMLCGFLGIELLAEPLAGMFGLSGETAELCIGAMRIISLSYLFAGANIAFQGIFQALEGGLESLILSLLRQFLLVIPVAYGLVRLVISLDWDPQLIWWTFVIAEGLSVLVAMFLMKKIDRKKLA